MSVNKLMNMMRMQAEGVASRAATTRIGTISSYNPDNYSAKVLLQPDETETGWLPIFSPWIGNGWGMYAPPTIGDMVKVHFQEGNIEVGIVSLRGYNDSDRPLTVSSGEFWLVHQSGSLLKFHNDGSVELASHGNLTATVGGNMTANVTGNVASIVQGTANLTITGNVTASAAQWSLTGNLIVNGTIVATGDISDNNGVHGTLQHIRVTYNGHTHDGGATPLPQLS